MGRVLLTDGRSLATLAIARSLGSRGIAVDVGEEFRHTITSYSKHVDETITYPSPDEEPERFLASLLRALSRADYDLVIPTRDVTTRLLAQHRDRIEPLATIFLADSESIERFADKGETIRLARQVGTPIPRTHFPEDTPIETIAAEVGYPALVRARRASGSRGIVRVNSPGEVADAYKEVKREHGEPIVQEYVSHDGGHFSVGTLFDEDSEPVAIHVYEELKQYPTSGGPAVEARSVPVEPWVDDMLDILRAVGWVGPAHMDVLYDPADETYKLLEVNPRFWMSVGLTIRSGVDVPKLLVALADGNAVSEPVTEYDTDLLYRWLLPNGLLWAGQQERRLTGLLDFLRPSGERVCYGTLSGEDPLVAVGVGAQSVSFLLDRDMRRQVLGRETSDTAGGARIDG